MRAADAGRLAELAARIAERGAPVPLLALRLPDLERTAWSSGLRAARALERRAARAFAAASARVLRGDDALAHEQGSDLFAAALLVPARGGADVPAVDPRAALARIAAAIATATGSEVLTGWTLCDPADDVALPIVLQRALACGAAERERYAFFSAIGHELRTPLASIRGYLETLLDGSIPEPTRRRFVRIAYAESVRLSRLVEGMFEISLLDLQPAASAPRTGGTLARALDAVGSACGAAADARGVLLAVPHAVDAALGIEADRLGLVLINLVDNAIKHGRSPGRVELRIAARTPHELVLTVDDDGPGIPAADRERVFALGERGTTAAPGNGIGLALVHRILERAGGRVALERSPLGGARFIVAVPAAPPDGGALRESAG